MAGLRREGADRLIELLGMQYGAEVASEPYIPWDKLRHKQPPDGMSSEEWWLITKLARQAMQRKLPLKDKGGRSLTYALPDQALKAVEEVNRHLSGHIAMAEQVTDPNTRDRYLINSLIEEAITSSQLEGALTTQAVAKDMIKTGRRPSNRDEQMILNNYTAMMRMRELRGQPISLDLIYELHGILTSDTLDNPGAAGSFQRPSDQRIVVADHQGTVFHVPPSAEDLPERVQLLCDFANGEVGGSTSRTVV